MPIPVKILQSDGKLISPQVSADSLDEVAINEPEGIYTVARTFSKNKVVLFDAHLDRLEESARLENIDITLNHDLLRQALSQLIEECGYSESRFRITIPKDQPDQIWLAVEPLQLIPLAFKQEGVIVATCKITRPNPRAKSNAWVNLRNEAVKEISEQVYEGIIVSEDGHLMEGFSSNFYAIVRGSLHTAEHDILHGIARRVVLAVAPDLIPLQFLPIHIDQLAQIDEAFLTSSSRGVVPIVQINGAKIADGTPGASTHQLCAAYDNWVDENMQPIT